MAKSVNTTLIEQIDARIKELEESTCVKMTGFTGISYAAYKAVENEIAFLKHLKTMAKVLTFSKVFPKYHPKAGEPTYFVEQIMTSLMKYKKPHGLKEKHHTIRAGKRWKVGDKFSPRVWSGKPYASKQIIISPDFEVVKIWDFEMKPAAFWDECKYYINGILITDKHDFAKLAENDGLSPVDFALWFAGKNAMDTKRKSFSGQIICWSDDVQY